MGTGFAATAALGCRTGTGLLHSAVWRSSSMIECTVGTHPSGVNVTVQVSNDGQHFSSDYAMVEVLGTAVVKSVEPSRGSTAGNELVTVSGSGLGSGTKPMCRFGISAAVPATLTTRTTVVCYTPALASGKYSVHVSADGGLTYSDGGHSVRFDSVPEVWLRRLDPSSGPAGGETVVRMIGVGLDLGPRLRCAFGASRHASSILRPISSTLATCISPVQAPQATTAVVDVVLRAEPHGITSNTLRYAYYAAEVVLAVQPSSGPADGGTLVTVWGRNFIDGPLVRCRFGGATTSAVAVQASHLVCAAPRMQGVGNATVAVTSNGMTYARTAVQYEYRAGQVADAASAVPSRGPVHGGTSVVVSSAWLRSVPSAHEAWCWFEGERASSTVRAVFTGQDGHRLCTAPSMSAAGPTRLMVTMQRTGPANHSAGGTAYSSFEYMDPMAVASVQPSVGSVQGGTIIEVHGSGYAAGKTACIFGTSGSMLVRAEVTSSSLLSCMAPAGAEGDVALEVTGNDGADRSSDGRVFRYVRDGVVERVEPSFGPEAGGTSVTVIGRGFVSSGHLECRVGVSSASRGTWKTSSMVTCVMPARRPGNTTVEVGNSAQLNFRTKAQYEYQPLLEVLSVSPSTGPLRGATLLTITTSAAPGAHGLAQCIFGCGLAFRKGVPASTSHGPHFTCITPAGQGLAAGPCLLHLEVGIAHEMRTASVPFVYTAPLAVLSVQPSVGSVQGGTIIEVHGSGYAAGKTACIFGTKWQHACEG